MATAVQDQPAAIKAGRYLFRCDANAKTGLGHLSRCLALAEALMETGARCHFGGDYSESAQALLRGAGFDFSLAASLDQNGSLQETLRIAADHNTAAVIDSYSIDPAGVAEIERQTPGVVLIDDFAQLPAYPCAVVLNFTVNASRLSYPEGPCYLLGPDYLLVRRRMRQLRARTVGRPQSVRRLLLSIGGTDRHQLASRVLDALGAIDPGITVRVASGSQDLAPRLKLFGPDSGLIAAGSDLAEEFASADACISGGGLSKYEAAYVGVPVAVLSQTPEQAGETEHFARHRLAFDLGYGPEVADGALVGKVAEFLRDAGMRQSLVDAGRTIFPVDPTRFAAEAIASCLQLPARGGCAAASALAGARDDRQENCQKTLDRSRFQNQGDLPGLI